jgi:hypothetical protein
VVSGRRGVGRRGAAVVSGPPWCPGPPWCQFFFLQTIQLLCKKIASLGTDTDFLYTDFLYDTDFLGGWGS